MEIVTTVVAVAAGDPDPRVVTVVVGAPSRAGGVRLVHSRVDRSKVAGRVLTIVTMIRNVLRRVKLARAAVQIAKMASGQTAEIAGGQTAAIAGVRNAQMTGVLVKRKNGTTVVNELMDDAGHQSVRSGPPTSVSLAGAANAPTIPAFRADQIASKVAAELLVSA